MEGEPRPFALWKVCYFGMMAAFGLLFVLIVIGVLLGSFNPIP